MRVLLDENLPVDLSTSLKGHDILTAGEAAFLRLKNGKLLTAAEGFYDAFLTMDKGILFQHDLRNRKLRIGVIQATNSRMQTLEPVVPNIQRFVDDPSVGQFAFIREDGIEPFEIERK